MCFQLLDSTIAVCPMSIFEGVYYKKFYQEYTESFVSVKVDWLKIMWIRVKRVYNKRICLCNSFTEYVRSTESAFVMIPCSENERYTPQARYVEASKHATGICI